MRRKHTRAHTRSKTHRAGRKGSKTERGEQGHDFKSAETKSSRVEITEIAKKERWKRCRCLLSFFNTQNIAWALVFWKVKTPLSLPRLAVWKYCSANTFFQPVRSLLCWNMIHHSHPPLRHFQKKKKKNSHTSNSPSRYSGSSFIHSFILPSPSLAAPFHHWCAI